MGELHLPHILVGFGLGGHDFAAVDDRPAADRQDQVNVVLAGELGALLDLGVGGVGHDAAKIGHRFAGGFQLGDQRVIDAGALD